MNRTHIQMAGLIVLGLLAGGLLGIIVVAIKSMADHISPDGKVPVFDAGLFTSALLAFTTTIGAIRSIWETQERAMMAAGLQNSTQNAPPPANAAVAAQNTADAAQATADKIKDASS